MNFEVDYDGPFPYHLVEVLNGTLTIILFWMIFFLCIHIWHLATEVKNGPWKFFTVAQIMYYDYKPELALLLIVTAFWFRSLILWYVRWFKHEEDRSNWITLHSSQILVVFTIVALIGVACWIRVISPFSGKTSIILWTLMISSSIAFGIGMHYFF